MLGSLLKALARRLLHIVTLHYVDDYFGTDRDMSIEHVKLCFARLVRACLGQSAIASKKLEHGQCLVILGVEIRLSTHGATFWPSPEKVAKWCAEIKAALVANVKHLVRIVSLLHAHSGCMCQALECGAASKLSGKLQWASQSAFQSLGRAMLRALIDHARRNTNPVLSKELQQALKWWLQLLQLDLRSATLAGSC